MSIVAFLEVRDGVAKKSSLEALSEARRWADRRGTTVTAVVVGSPCEQAVTRTSAFRPDRILVADDPLFSNYSTQAYAAALAQAASRENAEAVFVSATAMGKEVVARTAAKFQTGALTDVVSIDWQSSFKAQRPVYSGKAYAEVEAKAGIPVFVSLRPNVFPLGDADPNYRPEVQKLSPSISADDIKGRVTEIHKIVSETVELGEAEIIVSGGRGLKGPEHFYLVKDLAKVLGAAMGASRAVVD